MTGQALLPTTMLALAMLTGCTVSRFDTEGAELGSATDTARMIELANTPADIRFTKIIAADWVVDRAGLINLEHEHAIEQGLTEGDEPIQISFYAIEHPERGTFWIDSGVSTLFRDEDTMPVSSIIASQMNFGALDVHVDTADWIEREGEPDGVFLTHAHLDHIMGLPDLPTDVPVYFGPGELETRAFINMFVRRTTNRLIGREREIYEWEMRGDPSEEFAGLIDVFGDETVFAIHVPGHTAGSVAFLVRTQEGPQLILGDSSHTNWGWNHCVEPGEFSEDIDVSAESLRNLKHLEAMLPELAVHLGHQHHEPDADAPGCAH